MKISIKNLGALKEASFTLGDFTIICGNNNTGKTYATYALFGFLYAWHEMFSVEISQDKVNQLLVDGVIRLDIGEYVKQVPQIISKGCRTYTQNLSRIFAAPSSRFKDTEFDVSLDVDIQRLVFEGDYERKISTATTEFLLIAKDKNSLELVVTLLTKEQKVSMPINILTSIISQAILDAVFSDSIPRPFIASAERTGAAIFRKELNFARNRLLEEMSQSGKRVNPMELLFKVYQDYALPIEQNVDFTRQLESIVKKASFIAEEHPDLLDDFAEILGGQYTVTREDSLYYVPKGRRIRLSMDESSSSVRSLLDIGFYLRHEAVRGDLLIVDEPELNLHPENQRRVVRLFARLINLGIRIFITTHSDYIVKELNTLIMLNREEPYIKKIANDEGYRQEELISHKSIKLYIAEEALVRLEGKTKKSKCQTLTPANIDEKYGIEARSFDVTIETMNRIQEAIVWGQD